jgi:queuine tRNA-ribosyltransferase
MNAIATTHGTLHLPAFFPDATRGVVRATDSHDLLTCGIQGLMANALHLASIPGLTLIRAQGGLHRFMGWDRPIATDSGGFQLFSMAAPRGAAGHARLVSLSDEGVVLEVAGRGRTRRLSPEKSIQQQWRLGADLLFCLDQCPPPHASGAIERESVQRTLAWAGRCKRAFTELCGSCDRSSGENAGARPLLFAVVQGGGDRGLRRECALELATIGFDGYGFGGWPVDDEGRLLDLVAYVAGLLPSGSLLHGLGIGKPDTLVGAWRAGYQLFDCVIPTRDGRHGRLFVFRESAESARIEGKDFYREIGIESERYARERRPVEPECSCPLCAQYSAAYLHHLFKVHDAAAARLATLHNLTFYVRLMKRLRELP